MRGLVLVAAAVLVLASLNVTPANAASQYCYHLGSFCDQIQVQKDSLKGWYGIWDWQCNGVDLTSIAGKGATMSTRPVVAGAPSPYTFRFRFWNNYGTFDLVANDGSTFTIYLQNEPFTRTKGVCTFFTGPEPKKPSLASTIQAPSK
jgi:hypothetical protein